MEIAEAGTATPSAMTACSCSILKSIDWSRNPREGFYVGMRCALDEWDVLRTAINDGWAGSDRIGHMHRNELHCKLARYFAEMQGDVDADDIADMLTEFISSKFNCDLEDDSMDFVATLIIQLYKDCKASVDFSGLQMMIARNPSPPALLAVAQNQPQLDSAPKCSCQVPTNQTPGEDRPMVLAEIESDEEVPGLVDQDGWQTVPSKKSRRKRPQ